MDGKPVTVSFDPKKLKTQERLTSQQWSSVPQTGQLSDLIVTLGKDCASHLSEAALAVDHGDLLYEELGLPM